VIQVFGALSSVAFKSIKAVKALHDGIRLTTVFKEANQWVVEERKVTFAYEQVKF